MLSFVCNNQPFYQNSWHTPQGGKQVTILVTIPTQMQADLVVASRTHATFFLFKKNCKQKTPINRTFIVSRRTSVAPSLSGVGPRLLIWLSTPCVSLARISLHPVGQGSTFFKFFFAMWESQKAPLLTTRSARGRFLLYRASASREALRAIPVGRKISGSNVGAQQPPPVL